MNKETNFIYGKNPVIEAINAKKAIRVFLVSNFNDQKVLSLIKNNKVPVSYIAPNEMDKMANKGVHQGIGAELKPYQTVSLEEIIIKAKKKEKKIIVMLDGIEDPHNLGAIIRTCECAGVDGIVIPKVRACQVNETVVRTSAGAISNMKIARVTNLKTAIDFLKENGLWIYVAETGGENIYTQNLTGPIAVVIGSEGNGVKQSLKSYCDGVLTLPLHGSVNSLNASCASAIVVYEILRQREEKI